MSKKPEQQPTPLTISNPAKGQKTVVVWENGVPRAHVEQPKFDKHNSANLLAELSKIHLNFPYDGDEEKYFGMTKGEAMIAQWVDAASTGDADARKDLMDRVMGKPQQNIKSVSIKGSIGDFLDTLDTSEEDVIDI